MLGTVISNCDQMLFIPSFLPSFLRPLLFKGFLRAALSLWGCSGGLGPLQDEAHSLARSRCSGCVYCRDFVSGEGVTTPRERERERERRTNLFSALLLASNPFCFFFKVGSASSQSITGQVVVVVVCRHCFILAMRTKWAHPSLKWRRRCHLNVTRMLARAQ